MARYPSTIKTTRLGLNALAIYETGVHYTWIKGYMTLQDFESRCGGQISPSRIFNPLCAERHIEVSRFSFPFAKTAVTTLRKDTYFDCIQRKIICRGMACFERTYTSYCFRYQSSTEFHLQRQ